MSGEYDALLSLYSDARSTPRSLFYGDATPPVRSMVCLPPPALPAGAVPRPATEGAASQAPVLKYRCGKSNGMECRATSAANTTQCLGVRRIQHSVFFTEIHGKCILPDRRLEASSTPTQRPPYALWSVMLRLRCQLKLFLGLLPRELPTKLLC
ncbi:hypothetical protein C8R44DRAFT_890672 [Mycena epipterygia]|nr:hypothetical protein C8R44DRAFT_890672 [Mycena epipterygia]